MKRMTCVVAAMTILACSTQGFAQTGPTMGRPDDKMKGRLAEALNKSKLMMIKVKNPKDLSGADIKGGEVKGVVKSVKDACFQFEYKDGLGKVKQDCIPYGDAMIVQWQMRALQVLKMLGVHSAFIAGGLALMPIVIPLLVIAGLLGHPLDC